MWGVLRLLLALSRGGLGNGDVALAPFLGWFLGAVSVAHVFVAVVMSFVIAGFVVGVALALRRVRRSTHVPFGPFLAAASLITIFAGGRITSWWLG
jgi:leader peptidase (prepilin peptidase)/N-methyltransferase